MECRRFQGKLIKNSDKRLYLDQISDTIIWVHYRHFRNYLLSKYNLTYELYYKIVIYGDINFQPKCPICGNKIPWNKNNKLCGYASTCSKECSDIKNSITNTLRLSKIEYSELSRRNKEIYLSRSVDELNLTYSKVSESLKLYWSKFSAEERSAIMSSMRHQFFDSLTESERKEYVSNRISRASLIKADYHRFLNQGSPSDICQFYIATTKDNKFKFGVTKDIQMRNLFGEYKRAKILKIGRRDEIAKIEYLIKLGLNSTEYLEYGNLRDFRKLYIDSTSQDVMVTGVYNT